ncbi:MAG TPA: Hsp20/alpha crystallin family protein [Thermomicrobiaceae bacterium]|nr:Hsp20/alpha crystallin family protein [Thermomicrobiaceae bacterium]
MFERMNPLNEVERMLTEMDRRLGGMVGRAHLLPWMRGVRPAIDLYDTGESLILKAAIPGARVDDIDVAVEHGVVTLRGHVPDTVEKEEAGRVTWYQRIIPSGPFNETVHLPAPVDPDLAVAAFADAVLTLTLPKVQEARVKHIAVRPADSVPDM